MPRLFRQHGARFLAVMPTNLYGLGDHYNLQNSHVLPALIRKMHEAKLTKTQEVVIWGTGQPRREFLYSDDLAKACMFLMTLDDPAFDALLTDPTAPALINIGCGADLTIADLAQTIAQVIGFTGRLTFDPNQPDGTPRKLLDTQRINRLGWRPTIALEQGIAMAYQDFLQRQPASG